MRRFTPLRPDPRALLARANPVAKLGAAAILMGILFIGSGPVTPAIVLAGLVAAVPLTGLALRTILLRTWPLLLAALTVGVLNVVLAPASGDGPDFANGAALGLRLLGIALSGVIALATTEPTELADSLQQQAHLPPRLAVGVLAAVRTLPIMAIEWQLIGMARRARGVSGGRSPLAAARLSFGKLLALLVGAVRRATRLALAMDARGFDTATSRTIARPQAVRPADWGLLLAAVALGAAALWFGGGA
ncbi:MAG TPA: energy-coupling factor transporter transmembrane component T [Methylomirabilota bacterium]|nr:energy-coupling factor transporter transmembrane component T [Methylomirabilota bacterium]